MVNFEEIITFLKQIAFPRNTGSKGHTKIQNLLRDTFSQMPHIKFEEQKFTASMAFMGGVLNLVHPLIGLGLIVIWIFIMAELLIAAFILTIIFFPLAFFSRQIIRFLQFRVLKWGKQYDSSNLISTFEPIDSHQSAPSTIVVMAHYDSISHKITPFIEGLGYFLGFFAATCYLVHIFVYLICNLFFVIDIGSPWGLIWGMPIALLTLIEFFNSKGNNSPGFFDNGTGIALLYYLAKVFAETSLQKTRVILVATGAEEWGDIGAHEYIRNYKRTLNPQNTRFILIDSFGTKDTNKIYYGLDYPLKHWSIPLETRLRSLIRKDPNIPLKFMAFPPLLQVATEHIPIQAAGYELTLFACLSLVFHSENDNESHFDQQNFETITKFIESFIRDIDQNPLEENKKKD